MQFEHDHNTTEFLSPIQRVVILQTLKDRILGALYEQNRTSWLIVFVNDLVVLDVL